MSPLLKPMAVGAAILAMFAAVGTALVSMTHQVTAPLIAENERQALLRNLHTLIDPSLYDNPIAGDHISVEDPLLGPGSISVYRARKQGAPIAVVINSVAPDGYGGDITMLVGIWTNGHLAGVRVVDHHETPGLGDKIEVKRSDWIRSFDNRALSNPGERGWNVKKHGGVFDQFSGATITPRAIVKAVYRTLRYYEEKGGQLFEYPSEESNHE